MPRPQSHASAHRKLARQCCANRDLQDAASLTGRRPSQKNLFPACTNGSHCIKLVRHSTGFRIQHDVIVWSRIGQLQQREAVWCCVVPIGTFCFTAAIAESWSYRNSEGTCNNTRRLRFTVADMKKMHYIKIGMTSLGDPSALTGDLIPFLLATIKTYTILDVRNALISHM